jgi:hypothetical protein
MAFGLPWATHFADGGVSILALVLWLGSVIVGFVRFHWHGLWFLLGAPLALFWPAAIVQWAGDAHFGF